MSADSISECPLCNAHTLREYIQYGIVAEPRVVEISYRCECRGMDGCGFSFELGKRAYSLDLNTPNPADEDRITDQGILYFLAQMEGLKAESVLPSNLLEEAEQIVARLREAETPKPATNQEPNPEARMVTVGDRQRPEHPLETIKRLREELTEVSAESLRLLHQALTGTWTDDEAEAYMALYGEPDGAKPAKPGPRRETKIPALISDGFVVVERGGGDSTTLTVHDGSGGEVSILVATAALVDAVRRQPAKPEPDELPAINKALGAPPAKPEPTRPGPPDWSMSIFSDRIEVKGPIYVHLLEPFAAFAEAVLGGSGSMTHRDDGVFEVRRIPLAGESSL